MCIRAPGFLHGIPRLSSQSLDAQRWTAIMNDTAAISVRKPVTSHILPLIQMDMGVLHPGKAAVLGQKLEETCHSVHHFSGCRLLFGFSILLERTTSTAIRYGSLDDTTEKEVRCRLVRHGLCGKEGIPRKEGTGGKDRTKKGRGSWRSLLVLAKPKLQVGGDKWEEGFCHDFLCGDQRDFPWVGGGVDTEE